MMWRKRSLFTLLLCLSVLASATSQGFTSDQVGQLQARLLTLKTQSAQLVSMLQTQQDQSAELSQKISELSQSLAISEQKINELQDSLGKSGQDLTTVQAQLQAALISLDQSQAALTTASRYAEKLESSVRFWSRATLIVGGVFGGYVAGHALGWWK